MASLRDKRKLAALSQYEVAQRSGISRMRLSLAECGQVALRTEEQNAVVNVLLEAIANRTAEMRRALSEGGSGIVVSPLRSERHRDDQ